MEGWARAKPGNQLVCNKMTLWLTIERDAFAIVTQFLSLPRYWGV